MAHGPAEADHPNATTAWAVVVAGGSGARFGGYKQFMLLAGREVVEWSLEAADAGLRRCGARGAG